MQFDPGISRTYFWADFWIKLIPFVNSAPDYNMDTVLFQIFDIAILKSILQQCFIAFNIADQYIVAFGMEQEIPDYDMDSEDEAWMSKQSKKLEVTPFKFETMMDRLEKGSGQTVSD